MCLVARCQEVHLFWNREGIRTLKQVGVGSPQEMYEKFWNKEGIDIATGDGVLRLLRLQFSGKNILSAAEILNGHRERFSVERKLI